MTRQKVIVSFTSYPPRMHVVHRVVESILRQTVLPDKIVLYLSESEFPGRQLPKKLTDLAKKNPLFEVHWCGKNIRSFKKLVPALAEYPNDLIINIDDDLLYAPNMIAALLRAHKKYPNAICGCRVRRVAIRDGEIGRYARWKRYKLWRQWVYGTYPKLRNMATTGGGTLVPPGAMHPDVSRDDLFMKICPTTDDLWFWAMAVRKGTKIAPVRGNFPLITIEKSQAESLMTDNCGVANLNDVSLKKILKKYPEIKTAVVK